MKCLQNTNRHERRPIINTTHFIILPEKKKKNRIEFKDNEMDMKQLNVAGRHGYAFGCTKPLFLWLIKLTFYS